MQFILGARDMTAHNPPDSPSHLDLYQGELDFLRLELDRHIRLEGHRDVLAASRKEVSNGGGERQVWRDSWPAEPKHLGGAEVPQSKRNAAKRDASVVQIDACKLLLPMKGECMQLHATQTSQR